MKKLSILSVIILVGVFAAAFVNPTPEGPCVGEGTLVTDPPGEQPEAGTIWEFDVSVTMSHECDDGADLLITVTFYTGDEDDPPVALIQQGPSMVGSPDDYPSEKYISIWWAGLWLHAKVQLACKNCSFRDTKWWKDGIII